uniref:Bridge-like lipid transfer protein family member 1 C-terminal domain-containing protein n=1 Tax=Glossina brevipalpis TaxID=37001 RepID=A0A1A9W3M5_9MUSC
MNRRRSRLPHQTTPIRGSARHQKKSPAESFYMKDNLKLDFEGQSTSTQQMISHGQPIGPARKLKTLGRLCYKNMFVGGIVGGSFERSPALNNIIFMALELRLEYMGTSVLMMRISSFSAAMKDESKTSLLKNESGIGNHYCNDGPNNAKIFIHGNLSWDQLQIMISKSTTADLLKMYYKLEEFFMQQFKSSKRVFSSLEPRLHERNVSIKRRQSMKKKSTGYGFVALTNLLVLRYTIMTDCEYKDDAIKLLNALVNILTIVQTRKQILFSLIK